MLAKSKVNVVGVSCVDFGAFGYSRLLSIYEVGPLVAGDCKVITQVLIDYGTIANDVLRASSAS